MNEDEMLFMIHDDTNLIDMNEIDLSVVPPEILAELDSIFSGEKQQKSNAA